MDQQLIWNELFLNQVENQNLPGSPMFAGDASMPFVDLTSDDSADLSIWSTSGPGSSRHQQNAGTSEEPKREHHWTSPLTINDSPVVRTQERQFELSDMSLGTRAGEGRLGNVNLDLNSNQVDDVQSFPPHSGFLRTPDLNAGHFSVPFIPGSSGSVQVPSLASSSNTSGSSSRGARLSTERAEGMPGSSFDARRLSCKRKGIVEVSAQCSASGSSNSLHHNGSSLLQSVSAHQSANTTLSIASSSNYPSATTSSGEQLNQRIVTYNAYNAAGRAESSQRNCRSRISPTQHATPSPSHWTPGINLRSSDHWSTPQESNLLLSFNQPSASRVAVAAVTSESQPPALQVPALVQNVHSFPVIVAPPSSRRASRSPAIAGQRSTASREQTNSQRLQRSNDLARSPFVPPLDMRHLMQQSSGWSLAHTSHSGSSSRVVQPSVTNWVPHQNPTSQTQRGLPVAVQRPSIPSGGSGLVQGINVPPQPSASFNTLQEMRNQSAAAARGLHQSYVPPTNGVLGVPLAMRPLTVTRDGSRRALSEHIRNALQLAWRGERVHLEDALFDHAVVYGVPHDLHDRHRDMRLDVDNMSYEELLALEERIGNVNTGLGEETVMKRLKQRKYISLTDETPSDVEPCCICQEEYVDEEDVGRLDCGHDFHTACIKQWLMMKNSCPICKTTGLATGKEKSLT